MAAINTVASRKRRQVPVLNLSARQLAAFYGDFATVREYVSRMAEHITLAGSFTHGCPPRSAPQSRFASWRVRLRAAQRAAVYGRAPLLGGLRHE